jgi:hypothetical protein
MARQDMQTKCQTLGGIFVCFCQVGISDLRETESAHRVAKHSSFQTYKMLEELPLVISPLTKSNLEHYPFPSSLNFKDVS